MTLTSVMQKRELLPQRDCFVIRRSITNSSSILKYVGIAFVFLTVISTVFYPTPLSRNMDVNKGLTMQSPSSRQVERMHILQLTAESGHSNVDALTAITTYTRCIQDRWLRFNKEEKWTAFYDVMHSCRRDIWQMRPLLSSLVPYPNLDEIKWSMDMDPAQKHQCTIVTIGVGRDVQAELKMRQRLNCDFFGADPVPNVNKQLYEGIGGAFYPFAIGATAGFFTERIMDCLLLIHY